MRNIGATVECGKREDDPLDPADEPQNINALARSRFLR